MNFLLSENEDLARSAISILNNYFSLISDIDIKGTGIVDFLISLLNKPLGKDAFILLCKLNTRNEDEIGRAHV